MKRLTIPSVLAVVVGAGATIGAVTLGAIAACGDDGQSPQECMVEGVCPSDGRVCLKQSDHVTLCCPICPIDNQCAEGCVLDFPPV